MLIFQHTFYSVWECRDYPGEMKWKVIYLTSNEVKFVSRIGCQELDSPIAKSLFYIHTFCHLIPLRKMLPSTIPAMAFSANPSKQKLFSVRKSAWQKPCASRVLEILPLAKLRLPMNKAVDIYHHLIQRPLLLLHMAAAACLISYIWTTSIKKYISFISRL